MKSRTCFLLLICVAVVTIFFIFFEDQRPTIQTLVTETNKQLDNIKNFKDNLQLTEQKKLTVDEKYLKTLGFIENPRLYPHSVWRNTSLPIIITTIQRDQISHAIGLIKNIMRQLPNHSLVIYNLGLSSYDQTMLMKFCNSSKCFVINFNFDLFPSHVSNPVLHAFRPIVIQDALNSAGAVLYIECNLRFSTKNLSTIIDKSTKTGIVMSAEEDIFETNKRHAVTSLTHPKMLEYFGTTVDNYQFSTMISIQSLLIFNTKDIHYNLMLPWVQCALIQDCIYPIGAQSEGCYFNKKPHFRYSGCHRYDESALNVVLGLVFGFERSPKYFFDDSKHRLFYNVSNEVAEKEYYVLQKNITSN